MCDHNAEVAGRLINNSTQQIMGLRYELNSWVDPVNERYVPNKSKDKRLHRDQITGELVKIVPKQYIPLENQKLIDEQPKMSEYWERDHTGILRPKSKSKIRSIISLCWGTSNINFSTIASTVRESAKSLSTSFKSSSGS